MKLVLLESLQSPFSENPTGFLQILAKICRSRFESLKFKGFRRLFFLFVSTLELVSDYFFSFYRGLDLGFQISVCVFFSLVYFSVDFCDPVHCFEGVL